MMIRTAGGPTVSPIDFNERKTPVFTRNTWIALGIVGAAHIALGTALYYQRFELGVPVATPERPPTVVEIWNRPKDPPPIPQTEPKPQPPTTKTNPLPNQPTTTDTVVIVSGDTATDSTVLTTTHLVPDPQPEAPPTPQPPQPPAVIRNPSWIRQPSGDQLMRAYPSRALDRGVQGAVTMNCLVQTNGRVSDCNVVSETPGNYGFGRAGQSLSRFFQINPRTVDGAAQGSRVSINLRFNLPD